MSFGTPHRSPRATATAIAAAAFAMIGCAWLWAQTRVNTQVNTRVNTQLYGGNRNAPAGTGTSVRYGVASARTSVAMDSEVRYEVRKQGALPSDIRMGYAAQGPLAPGGAMSYIPAAPDYRKRAGVAEPQRAAPIQATGATYSARTSGGYAPSTAGSVRYATGSSSLNSPSPSRQTVRTTPAKPSQISSSLSQAPVNKSAASTGSVRYTR